MVNNRLKVYGGEGTYMTSVGDELIRQGHDVQYFGLMDPDNLHGNRYGIYAKKPNNPLKLFKHDYNRIQFAKILDEFKPDIIHLNLIYFTLTPSILTEAKKRNIPMIQTVHDGKIVCPSYQLFIRKKNESCTLCLNGDFKKCFYNKCLKNSYLLSYIAYREAKYNQKKGFYNLIDYFVFPSSFMRNLHLAYGIPMSKTTVLCNFSRIKKHDFLSEKKEKYVLFFGRITKIKGVELVAEAAKRLPTIPFKIVGEGEDISLFDNIENVECLGFKSGSDLENIIAEATCSLFPSVCLENCPMSILESIALGTPVVGASIGGIPDLIDDSNGFLFEAGNVEQFVKCINKMFFDNDLALRLSKNCISNSSKVLDVEQYTEKLLGIIRHEFNCK